MSPFPTPSPRGFSGIFPPKPLTIWLSPTPPRPRGDFRGFPENPRKSLKIPEKFINTILPSRYSHLARPSSVRVQFKFKFKPFQSTGQQNWIVPITVHHSIRLNPVAPHRMLRKEPLISLNGSDNDSNSNKN